MAFLVVVPPAVVIGLQLSTSFGFISGFLLVTIGPSAVGGAVAGRRVVDSAVDRAWAGLLACWFPACVVGFVFGGFIITLSSESPSSWFASSVFVPSFVSAVTWATMAGAVGLVSAHLVGRTGWVPDER